MPPPFKTNPFYLPCLLGISRKDDKAEVSCVKQDTTSLHYVFLFIKAPAFIQPQSRAPLCLYDIFFLQLVSIESANQCLRTHTQPHTRTFTSMTRMEKNKHNIFSERMLGQQFVHNMIGSVKRKIHSE